jgi:hypothetical protein
MNECGTSPMLRGESACRVVTEVLPFSLPVPVRPAVETLAPALRAERAGHRHRRSMMRILTSAGQCYGRLTALEKVGGSRSSRWRFRCECGVEIEAHVNNVRRGRKRSCGCSLRVAPRPRGEG